MDRSPVQRLLNVTKWPTDCRVSTWICYFSHHFWHCTKFNARPFFLTTEVRSFFVCVNVTSSFAPACDGMKKKCQKKSAKMMTGSFLRYLHVSLAFVIYCHNLQLFKSWTKIKLSASCNFLHKLPWFCKIGQFGTILQNFVFLQKLEFSFLNINCLAHKYLNYLA